MGGAGKKTTFQLVLIKPTHYDDNGYPITWLRSHIPSNTLAALYGLGEDCRRRQVLGPDVDIVVKPFDETNIRVRVDKIVANFRRGGGRGLICMVGVQSNQFPRAVDLARQFIAAGLPVAMGGFHAAGSLAMLPVVPPEIQAAMDLGITIYAGEAEEGRLDEVLLDAWHRRLKPLYNYMDDLPSMEGAPTHSLPPEALARNEGRKSSFDLGGAARSSARSAPSSMCRAARAAFAPPTTSRRSCAKTTARASIRSSSPTTTWPAISTGRRSSTG